MSRRVPRPLTDAELAALLRQIREDHATGRRNRALLQLMADLGLRVSEALSLHLRDLSWERGELVAVTVRGKGRRERTVFATPQLSDKLRLWLEIRRERGLLQGPLFCTLKHGAGRPLSPRYVQQLVRRLAGQAGLEKHVTPHILRHTAACRRLRAGVNLRLIQEDLGHARLETTQLYTHVAAPERQAAALLLPPIAEEEAQPPHPRKARSPYPSHKPHNANDKALSLGPACHAWSKSERYCSPLSPPKRLLTGR